MLIGLSTGSISKGNFIKGLAFCQKNNVIAAELSVLRENELYQLVDVVSSIDTKNLKYFSVHAPSSFEEEQKVIKSLQLVSAKLGKPNIIVHPDSMSNISAWEKVDNLLVENMDSRKCYGQIADDLTILLGILSEANMCFDIGHAYQVDNSMGIAQNIINECGNKIKEIHFSFVNKGGIHETGFPRKIMDLFASFLADNKRKLVNTQAMILEVDFYNAKQTDVIKFINRLEYRLGKHKNN